MPGISTTASITKPMTKSHGDQRCQVAIGTWKAMPAATSAMIRKMPWRIRK